MATLLSRFVHANESPLQLDEAPLAQAIEEHGEEDDRRQYHRLEVEVDLSEDHPCLDHLDQHRADHRPECRPDAPEQTGSAKDGRGDHVEFLADAEGLIESPDKGDQGDAAERGADPRDHIDEEDDTVGVNASFARASRVVADRVDSSAERRAGQREMRHRNDEGELDLRACSDLCREEYV